ncbi:DUF2905 domain-containing protein [Thermohalobacter berrensis]|uniref:DUF2905 domain-containing protein n=1 Tax=Thermohalobacter berrensis TaxID=99594 RepID=A0A419TB24_9FIRM|nr:DUF2905 domain-containing protein [Thermohalobacter berrensis]RKD34663.1 hypothetical protein BET03_02210 [Thermohalobacter berrensis]
MDSIGRFIISIGFILIFVGGLILLLQKIGLNRLPGDIVIQKGNFTFFFPVVTSIVVSIILTIILNIISRFR